MNKKETSVNPLVTIFRYRDGVCESIRIQPLREVKKGLRLFLGVHYERRIKKIE